MDQFGHWSMGGADGAGEHPERRQEQHEPTATQQQPTQTVIQVCADVKPRLTKEQHDILEAHFQRQHKPSTNTKRQFADHLGVPLDKINNWFQNRRAKVKQDAKKQLNALQMYQGNFGLQQHFAPPGVSAEQLSQSFYVHHSSPSQPAFSTETPISQSPSNEHINGHFHSQVEYSNHVPTIMETTQNESRDGIISNLAAAGYPHMSETEPVPSFVGFDQQVPGDQFFTETPFTFSTGMASYPAPFGELPSGLNNSYDFQTYIASTSAPMQPMASTSSTTSLPSTDAQSGTTLPSSIDNSPMPSLTSGFPGATDDQKPSVTLSPSEQSDAPFDSNSIIAQQAMSSSPETMSNSWTFAQPQPMHQYYPSPNFYQTGNTSSQALLVSPPEQGDVEHEQANQADFEMVNSLPAQAYLRRESSTTQQLTQSLREVELQTPIANDPKFKHPHPPSSLAARRQRPRPAALNNAALRSASYSSGMPNSPGANANLSADQTLRRIRSSVGVSGRIQKPGMGSGQRSPLNFSFPDGAAPSPRNVRHASCYSAVTSPGISVTSNGTLAPPTPLTPSEYPRQFPPWQTHGTVKTHVGKVESGGVDHNGMSWPQSSSGSGYPNVSSPPITPMDPDQAMKPQMRYPSLYRDTPPQSAPAAQQTFPRNAFVPHYAMAEAQNSSEPVLMEKTSHFRRPSLPDTGNSISVNSQVSWNVPEFNPTGDLQMYPVQMRQAAMMGIGQYAFPQHLAMEGHSPASMGSSPQNQVVHANFSVHEYSPPQSSASKVVPPRSQDSAPKMYLFTNVGPHDFES